MQANTLWGLSNSPYVIQRQIAISRGVTLSIEAGVNIVFDRADSGLSVSGKINLQFKLKILSTIKNLKSS